MRRRPQPDSYARLMAAFTPRPIRTDADYEATVAALDRLAVRDEDSLDAGERDYLDLLTMLVSAYDARIMSPAPHLSPSAALKYLMSQSAMTPGDLAALLGSQSAASMILRGTRPISKNQAFKLAARFAMSPDLFLSPDPRARVGTAPAAKRTTV